MENILQHVVRRNRIRQELYTKQQALEAWRQVTEVLLTACPEDLLTPEDRQTVLFELLQELQQKVSSMSELTLYGDICLSTVTFGLCTVISVSVYCDIHLFIYS